MSECAGKVKDFFAGATPIKILVLVSILSEWSKSHRFLTWFRLIAWSIVACCLELDWFGAKPPRTLTVILLLPQLIWKHIGKTLIHIYQIPELWHWVGNHSYFCNNILHLHAASSFRWWISKSKYLHVKVKIELIWLIYTCFNQ